MIAGMRNNGCRELIAAALEEVQGVKDVQVNLYRAQAVVTHDATCAVSELTESIQRLGYSATPGPP